MSKDERPIPDDLANASMFTAFGATAPEIDIEIPEGLDVFSYERYIVAMSGGKDSLALLLVLLKLGISPDRIEMHHHRVDGGEGSTLMDWPITEGYCEALSRAFGVELTYSWRKGGIEAEMLRDNSSTAPSIVPGPDGYIEVGGEGPLGTRRKFPQCSADLGVRWCSSSAKIGVFSSYLCNHPKFTTGKTLVLTGERAEESTARANYKRFEPHRADLREGKKVQRHIDHWRAVHGWLEADVWRIIKEYQVVPHPAYWLHYGRVSCRSCIFASKNQLATNRLIAPEQFNQVANYEREFGVTIHRKDDVITRANAGTPYPVDPYWVRVANGKTFDHPIITDNWVLPPGAFGESAGPT